MHHPSEVLVRLPEVDSIRSHFPALSRPDERGPFCYLDGPGGTQVPRQTIAAMSAYLERSNANHEGAFATSRESDDVAARAHVAVADFLGAAADEVVFGPNMTTLTFAASRALGRTLEPGDEIVVTRLDHDANVAPWLALEEERGAVIRKVGIRADDCTLDLETFAAALGPRTRIVAVTMASNAVGTLTPIRGLIELAHAAGALTYVDAVHAAPHVSIDVRALDTDFLACSPYKFFGPHLGVLFGKREHLENLASYKVRPAPNEPPGKWETGTPSGEALAGLLGTFAYFDWLGGFDGATTGELPARRDRLVGVMAAIREREKALTERLIDRLGSVRGIRIRGIVDPNRLDERVPTVAFTLDGHAPREVAEALGGQGIAVWDGDYYAFELIGALGLASSGGMVRVGLVHYNTDREIDRLAEALDRLT